MSFKINPIHTTASIRSHRQYLDFLRALPGPAVHIWTPSRLRTVELRFALEGEGSSRFQIETFTDALLELLRFLAFLEGSVAGKARLRVLSDAERLSLLYRLLSDRRENFSTLFASIERSPSVALFPEALKGLAELLDLLRLNCATETLLAATIDEYGNTPEAKTRNEELLLLLSEYQEELRALGEKSQRPAIISDRAGLLEELSSKLAHPANQEQIRSIGERYGTVIIDQPTSLTPLERKILLEIAPHVSVGLVVDDDVLSSGFSSKQHVNETPPTLRYLAGVRTLIDNFGEGFSSISTLESISPVRTHLASVVLDLVPSELSETECNQLREQVTVRSCADRHEEAFQAARHIARLISEKKAEFREIQVVTFDLDAYGEILEEAFREHKIPFTIPRGKRLATTLPAGSLLAYLRWLSRPSLESAYAYFGGPSRSERETVAKEYDDFLREHASLIKRLTAALQRFPDQSSAVMRFRPGVTLDPKQVWDAARYNGVSTAEATGWIEHFLEVLSLRWQKLYLRQGRSEREIAEAAGDTQFFLHQLAGLNAELAEAKRLAGQGTRALLQAIKSRFFGGERRVQAIRKLELSPPREVLKEYVRARRALKRHLRESGRALESINTMTGELLADVGVIPALQTLLTSRIERGSLPEPISDGAVVITEILDARAVHDRHVLLLGATEDVFPAGLASRFGATSYEQLADRISQSTHQRGGSEESFFLVGHLIRHARELFVSFPREITSSEPEPATFALNLGEITERIERESVPPTRPSAGENLDRARALLEARGALASTPFDGKIAPALLDELPSPLLHPIKETGELRYNVTQLEQLADCRHRSFFENVLGLKNDDEDFVDRISREAGSVVHLSLQRFFETPPELKTEKEFRAACDQMCKIAETALAESTLDWDSHPAAREMRERIVAGLEKGENGQKQGYLRAALEYQRDVIGSQPCRVEYKFGFEDGAAPALRFATPTGETLIRGIVDRIDGEVDQATGRIKPKAIWDYKIGDAPALKRVDQGKSLQVPVYAAAIRNDPTFGELPERGGCVVLADPNRRDDEIDSLNEGVLIEHLAVGKKGHQYVLDPAQTAPRVEKTLERVAALDSFVRAGNFCQQSDTEHCPYCDFARICARDEFVIRLREGGVAAEATPRRNLTERRFQTKASSAETFLSSAQEEACDISTDIALLAGAGSGKTTVLWNRILRLVLNGESIEQIVAITFTEKAAREIRSRVERAITAILRRGSYRGKELSPLEKSRLHTARLTLPRSPIGTIHSFARRVLALDDVLAGGLAAARIVTGAEQLSLLERAADEALFGRAAVFDGGFSREDVTAIVERVLRAGVPFRALHAQVVDLMKRPRFLEQLRQVYLSESQKGGRLLSPEAREQLLSRFRVEHRRYVEEIRRQAGELINGWLQPFSQWMNGEAGALLSESQRANYSRLLLDASSLAQLLHDDATPVSMWGEKLEQLRTLLIDGSRDAKRQSKTNPRNFWKELRDGLSAVRSDFLKDSFSREEEALELAAALGLIAYAAQERYREEKRSLGVADFEDLILGAHRILCEPSLPSPLKERQKELFRRIPRLFRHIMVDEFQDTDEIQWALINACVQGISEGDGSRHTRFIVGDSQQAIYGFRGGDVRTLRRATDDLRVQGRELTLAENYRSDPQIISFVNRFFADLLSHEFHPDGTPRFDTASRAVALEARRAVEEKEQNDLPPVSLLITPHQKGLTRGWLVNEAERVASLIEERISLWNQPRSVGVLTRGVSELLLVADALRARGVPFSISHSSGFYDLDEVVALENLLRALANPGDPIPLVGVLRSPLFGFSDDDLLRTCTALNGKWDSFWSANNTEAGTRLQRYRKLAQITRASTLLTAAVRESSLEAAYHAVGRPEAFKNIERLIDALREAEIRGEIRLGVHDAIRWIDTQRAEGMSAPNANSTDDPVVLMTVHGAKGLEFPVVIVPFLRRRGRGGRRDFLRGEIRFGEDNLPLPLLAVRVEDEGEDFRRRATFVEHHLLETLQTVTAGEERRILYVAFTRAKDHLVLSFTAPSDFDESLDAVKTEATELRSTKILRSANPYDWLIRLFEQNGDSTLSQWTLRSGDRTAILPVL